MITFYLRKFFEITVCTLRETVFLSFYQVSEALLSMTILVHTGPNYFENMVRGTHKPSGGS